MARFDLGHAAGAGARDGAAGAQALTPAKVLNYVLYQTGWFCCVLGAAHGRPWWGAGGGVAPILVHLALLPRRGGEIRLLLLAGLVGAVVDSLQSCAGLLTFRSGYVVGCLAPPWIVVMWMQFATLFRFGLAFLLERYRLAALLAAAGGPLAFWIGARLGAVEFAEPALRSLLVLGAAWAVALPLLLFLGNGWIERESVGRYGGVRGVGPAGLQ